MVELPLRLPITPASSPEVLRLPGQELRLGRRQGLRLAERAPLRKWQGLKPLVAPRPVGLEAGSEGYPAECPWSLTALMVARAAAVLPLLALVAAAAVALVAELLWQVRAAAPPQSQRDMVCARMSEITSCPWRRSPIVGHPGAPRAVEGWREQVTRVVPDGKHTGRKATPPLPKSDVPRPEPPRSAA